MRFPQRAHEIVVALYNLNKDLANGTDNERRALTMKDAQTICFELGKKWGTKRADSTRPLSKDSIAFDDWENHILWSFDWQNGSTREPLPIGEMKDISGQLFVPVGPINHLSGTPVPITTPNSLPGREEMMATGVWLHNYYKSDEGLQRPEGLWIDGHPDWEGIGAWLFDVYLNERVNGKGSTLAMMSVVKAIRNTEEWKIKHPGITP
jgi:hypothetical protein